LKRRRHRAATYPAAARRLGVKIHYSDGLPEAGSGKDVP